ncbi:hypothetical protein D3C81_1998730 [compost metagenome]
MITVRQQEQAVSGGHSPFFVFFPYIKTAAFNKQQIEFTHGTAVWMLVARLIYRAVAFQKVRKRGGSQMNIGRG